MISWVTTSHGPKKLKPESGECLRAILSDVATVAEPRVPAPNAAAEKRSMGPRWGIAPTIKTPMPRMTSPKIERYSDKIPRSIINVRVASSHDGTLGPLHTKRGLSPENAKTAVATAIAGAAASNRSPERRRTLAIFLIDGSVLAPNGPKLTGADPHAQKYSPREAATSGAASGAARS
jgi:hypothetical protein